MRIGLATDFFSAPPPRCIAHRGGAGVHPENTLEAFAAAYREGIRYFELDVHASRDGKLVVCHDPGLERTTDLSGKIRELAYAEIARADAGYRFEDGSGFPFRGAAIRVPLLTDVLGMFDTGFFVIEVKQTEPSLVGELDRVLSLTRTRQRALIASEHQRPLDEIRALAPELPTSFSGAEVAAFFAAMSQRMAGYRLPADALQIPPTWGSMTLATTDSVTTARGLGIETHFWTVNEPAQMRELLSLGAAGIITDFPARLLELVAQL
jgi:glycerophosphoryl diester phosphodiesterase